MTKNIDDKSLIKELDPDRVGDSIAALPDQITQTLGQAAEYNLPKEYSQVNRIVLNGMGGSNLGAHLIRAVFKDVLQVPLLIEPGYEVPAYVDKNTLYIVSSYSGSTEEPLSTVAEVQRRGARIFAVTEEREGNPLIALAGEENFPVITFKPEHNPCGQPRLGVGYSIFSILGGLKAAGLLSLDNKGVEATAAWLKEKNKLWGPEESEDNNAAKALALDMEGMVSVLVGAEFLAGNLHILRNQICETSKNFAAYLDLPELNHYAMEGLANPESNQNNLVFLFFGSGLYDQAIQKRLELTKEVVSKNGINILGYKMEAKDKLGQALELLQFGAWISYYLGLANGINPVKIPWVDWFKDNLK